MISLRAEKLVRKLGGAKPMDVDVEILELALIKTRFDAVTRSKAIFLDHAGAAIDPAFIKLATQADEARIPAVGPRRSIIIRARWSSIRSVQIFASNMSMSSRNKASSWITTSTCRPICLTPT